MSTRSLLPLPFIAAIVLAFAALGGAAEPALAEDAAPDAADTVVLQMRIWQHVYNTDSVWISVRPEGGRWDTLGTVPFPLDREAGGYSAISRHRYRDLAIGGVGFRVWQRVVEPERIYVQGCAEDCPEREPGAKLIWRPLGMIPLSLDGGHSPSGRYRYGDLTVAVPRGNPGLLADREHLLALRDVFEGGGTELDWSPSRATADWEGVTVSGTPPRVTGLSLAEHGLAGEIWGYLGDLTELTELRLSGNELTGSIPSKLSLLTQLTDTYLAGNDLDGCVPPPLRRAANHDLDTLGLPDCPTPVHAPMAYGLMLPAGPHNVELWRSGPVTFDVPAGKSIQLSIESGSVICEPTGRPLPSIWDAFICSYELGFVLRETDRPTSWGSPGTWLVVDLWRRPGDELERTHYSGCIYDCGAEGSPSALIEQLIASVWVNTTIGDDGGWVWP